MEDDFNILMNWIQPNFFPSNGRRPQYFKDNHKKNINGCGTAPGNLVITIKATILIQKIDNSQHYLSWTRINMKQDNFNTWQNN